MRNVLCVSLLALSVGGRVLRAQASPIPGSISGLVTDESGQPIRDADVRAFPGTDRARTDSTGRFVITKLGSGFYHVRARKIGYSSTEITTDLTKDGHVDLKFQLKPRPVVLDSVVVLADGKCPVVSYGGFNCRRRAGKGVYLTDDDIADKGAVELGEAFSDVEGFRLEKRLTPFGMKPIPISTRGNHCLNALVNGRPISVTNPLPRYATELIAVEIYANPSEAPQEYQSYVWQAGIRQSSWMESIRRSPNRSSSLVPADRCALAVYWTTFR